METSIFQEIDEQIREKQKEEAGGFATFVWIGIGIYLYLMNDGVSFISWTALAFFVVGTFVAAVVFGLAIYLTQRSIAFVLRKSLGASTLRMGTFIRIVDLR